MTLLVRSARLGRYHGADGLNVTRTSGCAIGLLFAPSYKILQPMLARRRAAARGGCLRGPLEGTALETAREREAFAWAEYVEAFTAEMRGSYVKWRHVWDQLLARPCVTFTCFCSARAHCHTAVLRARIFPKLGARDGGEVTDE